MNYWQVVSIAQGGGDLSVVELRLYDAKNRLVQWATLSKGRWVLPSGGTFSTLKEAIERVQTVIKETPHPPMAEVPSAHRYGWILGDQRVELWNSGTRVGWLSREPGSSNIRFYSPGGNVGSPFPSYAAGIAAVNYTLDLKVHVDDAAKAWIRVMEGTTMSAAVTTSNATASVKPSSLASSSPTPPSIYANVWYWARNSVGSWAMYRWNSSGGLDAKIVRENGAWWLLGKEYDGLLSAATEGNRACGRLLSTPPKEFGYSTGWIQYATLPPEARETGQPFIDGSAHTIKLPPGYTLGDGVTGGLDALREGKKKEKEIPKEKEEVKLPVDPVSHVEPGVWYWDQRKQELALWKGPGHPIAWIYSIKGEREWYVDSTGGRDLRAVVRENGAPFKTLLEAVYATNRKLWKIMDPAHHGLVVWDSVPHEHRKDIGSYQSYVYDPTKATVDASPAQIKLHQVEEPSMRWEWGKTVAGRDSLALASRHGTVIFSAEKREDGLWYCTRKGATHTHTTLKACVAARREPADPILDWKIVPAEYRPVVHWDGYNLVDDQGEIYASCSAFSASRDDLVAALKRDRGIETVEKSIDSRLSKVEVVQHASGVFFRLPKWENWNIVCLGGPNASWIWWPDSTPSHVYVRANRALGIAGKLADRNFSIEGLSIPDVARALRSIGCDVFTTDLALVEELKERENPAKTEPTIIPPSKETATMHDDDSDEINPSENKFPSPFDRLWTHTKQAATGAAIVNTERDLLDLFYKKANDLYPENPLPKHPMIDALAMTALHMGMMQAVRQWPGKLPLEEWLFYGADAALAHQVHTEIGDAVKFVMDFGKAAIPSYALMGQKVKEIASEMDVGGLGGGEKERVVRPDFGNERRG